MHKFKGERQRGKVNYESLRGGPVDLDKYKVRRHCFTQIQRGMAEGGRERTLIKLKTKGENRKDKIAIDKDQGE